MIDTLLLVAFCFHSFSASSCSHVNRSIQGTSHHALKRMAPNYNYVNSTIADILDCIVDPSEGLVDPESLKIIFVPTNDTMVSTIELRILARSSQEAVWQYPHFPMPVQGLIQLAKANDPAKVFTATLLSLNMLESCIRKHCMYTTGKAPLLKTMLSQMNHPSLPILKTLLLPDGLNLRNLLWHGFITNIPPCWVALVLVLIRNLENDESQFTILKSTKALRSFPPSIRLDHPRIQYDVFPKWIPSSHEAIYNLAKDWITKHQYPTMIAALLSTLLEHTLRLEWCRHGNGRRDDDIDAQSIALPGQYYVTLDGHGQRQHHELLLNPSNSLLVSRLGGNRMALLTDLFASSCGGPNVRAALAHGMWDEWIHEELTSLRSGLPWDDTRNDEELWNLIHLLWMVTNSNLDEDPFEYQPRYSYTAVTKQSVSGVVLARRRLLGLLQASEVYTAQQIATNATDVLHVLRLSTYDLELEAKRIHEWLGKEDNSTNWTPGDVWAEHANNVKLVDCGAARTLLNDVERVLCSYSDSLDAAIIDLQRENSSSRHVRRAKTLCGLGRVASNLLAFTSMVGFLFIQAKLKPHECKIDKDELLKAVERSRMVVSTFETFYSANAERAIKAATDYTKGKPIKAILAAMNASC